LVVLSPKDVHRVQFALRSLSHAIPILALVGALAAPASALAAGPAFDGGGAVGVLRAASPTGPAAARPALPVGVLRPLGASTPGASAEDRIVELVNAERRLAGLAPLTRQSQLAATAVDYATVMADTDSFAHAAVDGSLMQERGEAHGYAGWTFMGENLAAGQDSPERVVQAWMASPAHRANVLAAQACDVGVGRATARGARYDSYWVMEVGCGLFSAP
jgi:uncharacterized protein YkwD